MSDIELSKEELEAIDKPLEVIIKNPVTEKKSEFDTIEDEEYLDLKPSEEDIETYYKEEEG